MKNNINRYSSTPVVVEDPQIVVINSLSNGTHVLTSVSDLPVNEVSFSSCKMSTQRKNNTSLGTIIPTSQRSTREEKINQQIDNINLNTENNE